MQTSPLARALALALLAATAADAAATLKLPSYIKTCSRNDPHVNECALASAKAAIPHLVQGDPKLKVPPLNPLHIDEVRVDQGGSVGLNLLLRDLDVFGLSEGDLQSMKIDFDKRTIGIDIFVPTLQLIGKYNISGRILILPIFGQGDANITLEKAPIKYTMSYEVEKRHGKEYMRVMGKDVTFDTSLAHFTFENLFNGDERLRANIRRVVSDNWRQVIDDVGPTVATAIAEVVTQVMRNILTAIPYDEIFPNK